MAKALELAALLEKAAEEVGDVAMTDLDRVAEVAVALEVIHKGAQITRPGGLGATSPVGPTATPMTAPTMPMPAAIPPTPMGARATTAPLSMRSGITRMASVENEKTAVTSLLVGLGLGAAGLKGLGAIGKRMASSAEAKELGAIQMGKELEKARKAKAIGELEEVAARTGQKVKLLDDEKKYPWLLPAGAGAAGGAVLSGRVLGDRGEPQVRVVKAGMLGFSDGIGLKKEAVPVPKMPGFFRRWLTPSGWTQARRSKEVREALHTTRLREIGAKGRVAEAKTLGVKPSEVPETGGLVTDTKGGKTIGKWWEEQHPATRLGVGGGGALLGYRTAFGDQGGSGAPRTVVKY